MSFLPGNLTPALLRSYRRKVISPFKRSFDFEIDICFTWIFLCVCVKTKKPITQSTINRREHRSRFKMMFYVIGFDIQRRVLLSNCSANRTNSVMSSPAFPVYRYLVGQFRFISSLCEHISIQLCMWNKFPHPSANCNVAAGKKCRNIVYCKNNLREGLLWTKTMFTKK